MDFTGACDWVGMNRKSIRRRFRIFRLYASFDELDCLQEAFKVALGAVLDSRSKKVPFEASFWETCEEQIASVRKMLPSSLCLVDIECIDIPREDEEEAGDIEELFETVRPFLTRREERMLSLKLGLTYEGALTNLEIAELLGCCESNVRDALKKALKRIDDLVRRGRIRPHNDN